MASRSEENMRLSETLIDRLNDALGVIGPPHLEAELAELGPRLEALQDYHQQPLARGVRKLAKTKKLIEEEQAVAYRAWIS